MRLARFVATGLMAGVLMPALAAQDRPTFLTVDQGSSEFQADQALVDHLGDLIDGEPTSAAYEVVVADVIESDEPIVARMTPYAYVAAQMQGADLDLIATYASKSSGGPTYRSYFVVPRKWFPSVQPEQAAETLRPADVVDYIRRSSARGKQLRFIYHKRLSTSSYFLPSLYLRSQRVFADPDSEARGAGEQAYATIQVAASGTNSSSDLVRMVRGVRSPGEDIDEAAWSRADTFAAVWDGTASKFIDDPHFEDFGDALYFVPLPTSLPCDVLVATRAVDAGILQSLRDRLDPEVTDDSALAARLAGIDCDVERWLLWEHDAAKEARGALSVLHRQALAPPAPVVVEVRWGGSTPPQTRLLNAARQAIRLSGTELVNKDEYYEKSDILWKLEPIHDGALRLRVFYDHFYLDSGNDDVEQEFQISFLDEDDLAQRLGTLIHSRMHRIRSVWLYQDKVPTVIRDVNFSVPIDAPIPFQEIRWENPERNRYSLPTTPSQTKVVNANFSKFELDPGDFRKNPDGKTLSFEPMARREYRVLLMRSEEERLLFRALTVIVLLLFGGALAGVFWDLRRPLRQRGSDKSSPPLGEAVVLPQGPPAAAPPAALPTQHEAGQPSPLAPDTERS